MQRWEETPYNQLTCLVSMVSKTDCLCCEWWTAFKESISAVFSALNLIFQAVV